jgi:hypothetical protein
MGTNIKKIAELFGAEHVATLPHTGGGAFGAARLAHIIAALQSRLAPSIGKRPGRPTDPTWTESPKVPMSAETEAKLVRLAELASTVDRKISPMQLAAQLLEDALAKLPDE